jgi:CubicO group peptidase (beta-lactamase class C family)
MTDVQGQVAPGFERVADAFRAVLELPGEDGAQFAAFHGGAPVVDLWGGVDRTADRPLPDDAVMLVASCSKGITAAVLAILAETGHLDLNALVSQYIPEYAQHGKEATTVAMVASHRAGQPFPPLGCGLTGLDYFRGPALVEALCRAEPWWEPGTAMGYHAFTAGALLSEIVRRATGKALGQHLQETVSRPLGLSMWLGLPEQEVPRVVPNRWDREGDAATSTAEPLETPAPGSFAGLRAAALAEAPPAEPDYTDRDQLVAFYGSEVPGFGGITDARSLARLYAATLGEVDGVRLYGEATLERMTTPLTDDVPALIESGTTGPSIRFGTGYQLASPSMPGFGPTSFGHTGAGGRLGLADPSLGVSIGFVCNRMRDIGPDGDDRWRLLIDAVRACL